MKILFVNSVEPQCGVHQYGVNLFYAISHVAQVAYVEPVSRTHFAGLIDVIDPDVVIYNWQAGIGGWMADMPFKIKAKQVLAYHDLEARFHDFDAILFSDPTMVSHDNWHSIGRPLRFRKPNAPGRVSAGEIPTIGINGFIGAWAAQAMARIVAEFPIAHIRLHLPAATYGDADGRMAAASSQQVTQMLPAGFTYQVSHDFMDWDSLVQWLALNDLNCYIRDPAMHWRGVSSSCDAAMCASRPIAINSCNAFRHLHDCSPSIMVEHRSLAQIMETGLSPLVSKYAAWSPEVVGDQVMKVLESVVK